MSGHHLCSEQAMKSATIYQGLMLFVIAVVYFATVILVLLKVMHLLY
jgi:hypothetical protein